MTQEEKTALHPLDIDIDGEAEAPEPDAIHRALASAAAELYGAKGCRATTLVEICTAAGVTEADFHARFSDTDELFCAAYALLFEELRAHLMEHLIGHAGSPEVIARRGLTAFYRYLRQRPAVARVVFAEGAYAGPRADALYHQQIDDVALTVNTLLGSLYEAELPASESSQLWLIKSLIGAVSMSTHMWIMEDFATPEDELIQTTATLFRAIIQQWLGVLRLDKKMFSARLPPRGEALVSLGYVLTLIDYLREWQQPLEPVLSCLGLDESDLSHHARMIPAGREEAAFALAGQMTGDAHFGLHIGERLRLPCLGVIGQLMMTCHSVEEVLVLHRRFGVLLRDVGRMEYVQEGDQLCLTLHHPDGNPQRERQRVERVIAGIITIGRELAGHYLAPERIVFPFPAPADCHEQQHFFRCPLIYDGDELRCYFRAELGALPLPGSAPELRQALEAEATRQLHALQGLPTDADPRIAALKHYIGEHLRAGQPELAAAAEALSTTPRNLQRLLESRRTRYSEIIDEVRRDTAVLHLQNPALSLVDVASELGFGDQSSFHKAFKRWFNTTPSEYRKTLSA